MIRLLKKYYKKIQNDNRSDLPSNPSIELLSETVKKYGAQEWYIYAYKEFKGRKHAYYAYEWILRNINKSNSILEIAVGGGYALPFMGCRIYQFKWF